MGSLRRFLSLSFLFLCCAVAGLASAQSISITFLNDWGEQTSRVLEEGRALLRVVDPGADVSPGPDQVSVGLSAARTQDALTTDLVETGPATGVFEGEVSLTTDFYADYLADSEYLAVLPGQYPPLDLATATYGGVSASAEAAPSLVDLLDDTGWSPAGFALGERVQVRVRDPYADRYAGQDTTVAVLSSSGGDSETLTLHETGARTGVFAISVRLVAGAPAAQDGRLQTAAGETLAVTHADANGFSSSSDTAGVTAASVRFIDRREGRPTEVYVEEGEVVVRVVDLAPDVNPWAFDSAAVTLYRSSDTESLTLRETGTDTGVFEGRMRLLTGVFTVGDGFLEPYYLTDPPVTDTVGVAYGSFSDTAQIVQSVTRLLDEAAEDATSAAPGQTLRIQVEAALGLSNGQLDSVQVQVRSLTTGDQESLTLFETGSFTWLFEGTLQPALGAAVAGDGQHQVQPGEVLEVEHLDVYNVPRSSDQVEVVRSAVRFVDESGRPASVLLEKDTARVEVLDLASAGQTPPSTSIESYLGADLESLSLTELGTPGQFESSIPMTTNWSGPGDGLLFTSLATWPRNHTDRVTARANGASASAITAPAILELLDNQGEPMTAAAGGLTLRVRARAPGRNQSSTQAESLVATLTALASGDLEYLLLEETGPDTGVFEGTFPTLSTQSWAEPDGLLMLRPSDTVRVYLDPYSPYESDVDATVAYLSIVPVVVELLDGDGRAASTYLLDETIHLRVSEPEANTSPTSAETVNVQVQARRWSDSGFDIETVELAETGPDTGVFTASLATETPSSFATPDQENGVLEIQEILPPSCAATTVTATRSGASDAAVFADSDLWLTDAQDQDATSFRIGSSIKIWLRRPRGNFSPGIDSEGVAVRNRTPTADQEWITLTETGGATGLFTGLLPVVAAPMTTYDGVLSGNPGDAVEASRSSAYCVFSFDRGVLAAPPNTPPDAADDSATTDEDVPVTIQVRANDTDPDDDPLTVTSVTQGARGSVAINAGSTVSYTPNADANGADFFTYTLSDGQGGTDTATVTVTITSQNDPPVAEDDTATTEEDVPVTITVRANDTDQESDTLTVTATTQGTKGTVTINAGTTVTYTPNANANGTDSFTYTVSDGNGGTDTATVTVSINSQNDPPVAVDDTATTDEDVPVTIPARANDTDPDDDALTVTAVIQGTKGSATHDGATVTYTPDSDANGTDSFTYTITDGQGGTGTATVTVTITPQNDPPVAVADTATTDEDVPATITVRANDTDPENDSLTVTAVTQGTKGAVTINAGATVTYTPNADANGTDSFTYTISDGDGGTDTATATVTITPQNDPPVAVADTATTHEDTPVTISVRSNDTDPENDTLTITAATQGTKGAVTIDAGSTVTYTPNANANGTDSFTYTISDGNGGTNTATVTVTVTAVNDPPVAQPDAAATNEDTAVVIPVLANDTDIDGGPLSVTAVTQGAWGTAAANGTSVTYIPAANFSGADSFSYTVGDGQGGTATATVTVAVAAVNDPPVAAPDGGETREGVAVVVSVLANDTDVEGNPLTVTSAHLPANGVTSLLPDNTVRYTPSSNFTGSDTFSYTVSDGQGGTSTGQVTVAVGEALERVAVMATNSVALRTGADVLSGDVIANQAGAGPFLNGAELSVGGSATTPTDYDLEGDSVTVAAGAVVGSDVRSNQLTNSGTINGQQSSPLTLPVFSALPPFLTSTPGSTTINVGSNGTRTLAAGSYLDLIVGRKGTVTFTGGTYHFRTIQVDREAKLYFSASSVIRVQQKLTTKNLTTIGPAAGAAIDASSIVFYVAGVNGTGGGLTATPKAVEIGTDNTLKANVYAPNGTIWLQDRTQATGAFLGRDVDAGADAQVTLDSAFAGGQ